MKEKKKDDQTTPQELEEEKTSRQLQEDPLKSPKFNFDDKVKSSLFPNIANMGIRSSR